MKRFYKLMAGAACAMFSLTACSPDDVEGISPEGVPTLEGISHSVTVDENNVVNFTFSADKKGLYPIWNIQTIPAVITTRPDYETTVYVAGDYSYTLQVGNHNGISDGTIEGTFHVDKTIFDFTPYAKALTGGSSKTWRVYASRAGHLGCGEPGSDGTNWWAAGPNEKQDNTIYDDEITFAVADPNDYAGTYTYDPGPNGHMFINHDVTQVPGCATGVPDDYDMPVTKQEATFAMTKVGDNVAIVLPAGTLFPFLTSDAQYNSNVLQILNADEFLKKGKVLELLYEGNGISWHYLFVNGEDEAQEEAFDVKKVDWVDPLSDDNIFKAFNQSLPNYVGAFYDPGWNWDGSGAPEVSFAEGTITSVWPKGAPSWEYWHPQFFLKTASETAQGVTLPSGGNYDFSITLRADYEVDGILVKVVSDPEGEVTLFEVKDIALPRREWTTVQVGKVPLTGELGNIQIGFTMKGAEEDTKIEMKDIILQTHRRK